MRAQSQRRLLWIVNAALGLGVAGVAAWVLLDVRPAAAQKSYVEPKYADAAVEAFKNQPPTNRSAYRPPVEQAELDEIDRPEFKTRQGRRFYWPYSGPRVPPPPDDPKPEAAAAPVEDDLAKVGRVVLLIYRPPAAGETVARQTVVFWEFKGGKRKAFVPGEFLVETVDRKAPAKSGIRLEDVRPKPGRTRVYEILYAVVEAGKDLPVKQGVYEYDAAIPVPAALAGRVRMPGEAAPTGPGGAEAPGTSAERREPGLAGGGPAVAPAAPAAGPAADLKPEVTWRNLDNADVAFDQGTYDYFRSADAQALAESVKTQEATDASGRVIGLKITGISQGTPADKFDVKPGDILVSINDQPVQSRSDAINVAQRIDPNADRVKVVIDRNGRQITYAIDPRDPKTRRAAATLDRGSR